MGMGMAARTPPRRRSRAQGQGRARRRAGRRSRTADEGMAPGRGWGAQGAASGAAAFYVSCGCAAIAAVTLETLILNQRYEVFYIWKNSNVSLPFFFRFASFWADQEGTFILWAVYGSILGLIFLRKAASDERWVMPFFCFIQAYLFVLMTCMSPFARCTPSRTTC